VIERRCEGRVPAKHHIAFRDSDGQLLHEECLTQTGFDGPYTIAYHEHRPHTMLPAKVPHGWILPAPIDGRTLAKRHYRTQEMERRPGPPVDARVPLLFNQDLVLSVLFPTEPDPVYFANGDGDDLFFIFEGGGLLRSVLGDVRFEAGDYLYVPRGLVHRFVPEPGKKQYWLSIDSAGGVTIPRQWRNEAGQLRMDAPSC